MAENLFEDFVELEGYQFWVKILVQIEEDEKEIAFKIDAMKEGDPESAIETQFSFTIPVDPGGIPEFSRFGTTGAATAFAACVLGQVASNIYDEVVDCYAQIQDNPPVPVNLRRAIIDCLKGKGITIGFATAKAIALCLAAYTSSGGVILS